MCWTDVQTCVILFSSCQSVSCLTRCDGKMSVVTDFLLGLQWHINGLNQIFFPKVMWISRGAFSRCFSAIVIDFFVFIPCWNQGTLRVLSLCRTVVMDHIDKMGTWDAEWKLRFFNLLLGPEWSYQYVGSPTFCKIISQKSIRRTLYLTLLECICLRGCLLSKQKWPLRKLSSSWQWKKKKERGKRRNKIAPCWLVQQACKAEQHLGELWYVSLFRKIKLSCSLLNDLSSHRSRPSKIIEKIQILGSVWNTKTCVIFEGWVTESVGWIWSDVLTILFLCLQGFFMDSDQVAVSLVNVCMHPLLPYPSTWAY